ncbi:unnamed protein product [Calypogeia fissa]
MQQAGHQGDGKETEVTWEDQQNINKFGRLNNKFHELEDDIKAKKDILENLEDAGNELILSDEEDVLYLIGEVFSHTPKEEVETKLEDLKVENEKELRLLLEEKESVLSQMADLKEILYGKFKDSINLEEE